MSTTKELDTLKKSRRFLRKSLTDLQKMTEGELANENNSVKVGILKNTISKKWDELTEVQSSLCALLSVEEVDEDCQQHHQYEMRFIESLTRITEYLQVNCPHVATNTSPLVPNPAAVSHTSSAQVRLPKIDFPTFNGDILTWQPYYQSIKVSVINNSALADVQKLEYIMRSLKGTAAEAVKGFSVVEENYNPVLETLIERFGHSRLILEAHMRSLIRLAPLTTEDPGTMRTFYDKVIGHVRSVESMGEKYSSETLAPVLVPLIVEKLPKRVIERWELHMSNDKDNLLSMKALCSYMEQVIRAKESSQHSSQEGKQHGKKEFPKGYQQKPQFPPKSSFSSLCTQVQQKSSCTVCKKRHTITDCVSFLSLTARERHHLARSKGLCFLCLEEGHRSDKCQSPPCRHCKFRHHSLLHLDLSKPPLPENPPIPGQDPQQLTSQVSSVSITLDGLVMGKVILQTIPAQMCGSNGRSKTVRCLLDPGSQTSFLKKDVADELGLDGKLVKLTVSGFGGRSEKSTTRKSIPFTLAPVDNPGKTYAMEALTTNVICQPTEAVNVHPTQWFHLREIKFPESFPREEKEIDVLIGMDYYYMFTTKDTVKGAPTEPLAVRTTLGWVFCGPAEAQEQECTMSMNVQITTNEQLNNTLQKFWDLESIGIKNEEIPSSTVDTKVVNRFKETLCFKDNRYQVSLPWKEMDMELESNHQQAENRLHCLERRLLRDPAAAERYRESINKYVTTGVAEKVPKDEIVPKNGNPIFYLPHHAIVREDKQTSKTRIVFDASAKGRNGISLNDCMHSGPALQPDLVGILLRFRKHQVALMADIEKMFLQILLDHKDRDSHRYLWRDLDLDVAPTVYRMTRVTFGVVASPFLAIGTTQEHARQLEKKFPEASAEILKNTYVDDLATGRDNVNEAVALQKDLKDLLSCGGFNLTKWSSNSVDVMKAIPKEDQAAEGLIKLEGDSKVSSTTKALGLQWNPKRDSLTFRIEMNELKKRSPEEFHTKREALSIAAKVFDPIGLIAPFTITSKILFQSLWTHGLAWDDKMPPDIAVKWSQWFRELQELEQLHIPRCYVNQPLKCCSKLEIHAFGDASERAYAAAIYLRAVYEDGTASSSLVMSKTRVAPVKRVTLPRLELMAAVITARLCTYVQSVLDCPITRVICWTDNSSTLHWVRGTASKWKTFVANRVTEIQSLLDPGVWRYCPGTDNPADLPSRGTSVSQLKESQLWWKGPSWLAKSEDEWPPDLRLSSGSKSIQVERKSKEVVSCVGQCRRPLIDFKRFGKYHKLLATIAWIRRFIHNLRREKNERKHNPLTAEEVQEAEAWLLKEVQSSSFENEILMVKNGTNLEKSRLKNLNPFLCPESGLLRVGGRIHKSLLSEEEKHPVILPSSHPAVELLILHAHSKQMHPGVEHTLSIMRQKFWILRGRSTVRRTLNSCCICRHYYTKPVAQRMAPLPADRIQPSPPFSNVGLDFAGPLHTKDSGKAYICLFTCAVTRAIHLELVSDMKTERFLLALRRLVARRGMCSIIWSDNAKSFKCANKELQRCWRVIEDDRTQAALAERKIEWKFIVEKAPWWGGFYERLVRSVKTPLKKVFGKALLDAERLATILTEIEAQINSRPLTYLSTDPNDLEVLTPAQILIGRNLQQIPAKKTSNSEHTSSAMVKRWRYHQKLVNDFWKRWNSEYLKSLNTMKKWTEANSNPPVKVGDLVLIQEDRVSRGNWPRARIEEVHQGRDGLIRSATLRTSTRKQIRRPVQRLHILEAGDADSKINPRQAGECSEPRS